MQQTLTIPVQLPDDVHVITTSEYDRLAAYQTTGRMWSLKELQAWTNKGADWLKDNIIYSPKYADTVREWRRHKYLTGGGYGSKFHFKASVITEWLEAHWEELPW